VRLLVLDGSRILPTLVQRIAPPGVEAYAVSTIEEAIDEIRLGQAQAVIANIGPANLPWKELQRICEESKPPIPVLFESCVHQSLEEAGMGRAREWSAFVVKPYPLDELRKQVEQLTARAARAAVGAGEIGGKDSVLGDRSTERG